jgi:hypothetical protein
MRTHSFIPQVTLEVSLSFGALPRPGFATDIAALVPREFSPDFARAVTVSEDKIARLWVLIKGKRWMGTREGKGGWVKT